VSTHTIGQIAERSGFPASTLRYYDEIGLVEPATRTEAGYRLYDDRVLSRLSFISRAKALGCSLEEISELVVVWAGDRCEPVQRRLHDLVTAKIADIRRETAELVALGAQLESAAAKLSGPPTDGPCDDHCACASGAHVGDDLIACTLEGGPAAIEARVQEWQAVLGHVRSREAGPDGALRLTFANAIPLAELARLVTAERQCCRFFAFSITVDERGIGLEVRAPQDAGPLVASLFGSAE
jgi:DNA-binding transcriptional MerR regulator